MDFRKESKIARLMARKIAGEITAGQQAELDRWADASPRNRELYRQMLDTDIVADYVRDAAGIDPAMEIAAIGRKIRRRRGRRTALWSASACAAAMAVFIVLTGVDRSGVRLSIPAPLQSHTAVITLDDSEPVFVSGEEDTVEWREVVDRACAEEAAPIHNVKVEVPRGNEYKLTLGDGTRVWLNSDSRIEYPIQFTGDTREVRLTGEAYFEVERDEHKPFIVRAGAASIEVLGTAFNVSAYEGGENLTATLVSGSVGINCGDNRAVLTPGQQATVSPADGAITTRDVDTGLYISWTSGFFEFDAMELSQICTCLERWYDVEFVFTGDCGSERFTGAAWKYKPLEDFLDNIERVTDVTFKYKNGQITVSPNK